MLSRVAVFWAAADGAFAAVSNSRQQHFLSSASSHKDIENCGAAPTYPNTRTANFADSKETKYVSGNGTVKVEFTAGQTIEFECLPGFTTDGSKAGNTTFDVLCSDMGYYKPGGVCLEASLCGSVPTIANAIPTGKDMKGAVQMGCADGYSLDGEEVVAGGMGENKLFTLKCVEFSGAYEEFTGECKLYGFVGAAESTRMYNQVFEVLFTVSCKGTLKKEFGAGKGPGVDDVCGKLTDADLKGDCAGLVSEIEADFETQKAAREAHDDEAKKEWHEEKDADRPGIADEAKDFCTKLWKLLELQPKEEPPPAL